MIDGKFIQEKMIIRTILIDTLHIVDWTTSSCLIRMHYWNNDSIQSCHVRSNSEVKLKEREILMEDE